MLSMEVTEQVAVRAALSAGIIRWYQQTFEAGGLTWAKKEEMVNLPADWWRPLALLPAS